MPQLRTACLLLQILRQPLKARAGRDQFGRAPFAGNDPRRNNVRQRRDRQEGRIRVPKLIGLQVQQMHGIVALYMVRSAIAVRDGRGARLRPALLRAILQRPEQRPEPQVGGLVEFLAAKQQGRLLFKQRTYLGIEMHLSHFTQIDTVHFNPEARVQRRRAQRSHTHCTGSPLTETPSAPNPISVSHIPAPSPGRA